MLRFRALTVAALAIALVAAAHAGSEGRIAGEVFDEKGEPLADVAVTVRGLEMQFEKRVETNRKGKFTLMLLDATRSYAIRLEKPGYRTIEEPLDPELGGVTRLVWTLVRGEAGGAGAPSPDAQRAAEELEATGGGKAVRLYKAGAAAYESGDLEGAMAKWDEALAEEPDLAIAHAAIANVHLDREEFGTALGHALRVTELAPEEVVGYRMVFDAHWGMGEREKALAVLERLIEMDPGPSTAGRIFNVGVAAVRENRLDEARARFEQALQVHPELSAAHLPLGQIHFARSNWEGARDEAAKALAAEPENFGALLLSYRAHHQLGNAAEADAAFKGVIAADAARAAEMMVDEGAAWFGAGQTAQALAAFRRALEAEPDHPRANYRMGLALASTGNLSEAKQHLARFLELAPEDPEAAAAREMLAALQ